MSLTDAELYINGNAKLTVQQVSAIRGSNQNSKYLQVKYGISADSIERIRNGTAWPGIAPSDAEIRLPDPNNPVVQGNWRQIKGYEGLYDISDDGRVRSWSLRIEAETGCWPALITPKKANTGYLMVGLYRKQEVKHRAVHTLVSEAFIGPANGLLTLHGDGSKTNNNLSNLRYGTHQDNYEDAVRHGTRKKAANGR